MNLSISSIKQKSTYTDNVLFCTETNRLILIGAFWDSEFIDFLKENICNNVINITFESEQPFTELIELLLKDNKIPALPSQMNSHNKLISLLNARVCSKMINETQPLITGLFNVLTDFPIMERYYKLFFGEITLEEVEKLGTSIIASQQELIRNRVLASSRVGTFSNGLKYSVTNSPDLIGLSHEELKKQNPDVDITISTWIQFKTGKEDKINHSIRSWNSNVDAREIVGQYGGGDNEFAARATRNVNINIDY